MNESDTLPGQDPTYDELLVALELEQQRVRGLEVALRRTEADLGEQREKLAQLEGALSAKADELEHHRRTSRLQPEPSRSKTRYNQNDAVRFGSVIVVLLIGGWLLSHLLLSSHESANALQTDPPEVQLRAADTGNEAPRSDPSLSPDELSRKAEHLFEAGNLAEAARVAEEAAAHKPESAHRYRLLGYIRAALGDERKATEAFAQASRVDPGMRISLADFHLARAWIDLESESRRHPDDTTLADRLRALAGLAEINPELRAIARVAAPQLAQPPVEVVPPMILTEAGRSALVVEKRSQTARVYSLRGTKVVITATYPVTTGQAEGTKQKRGDLRTPDGVYSVTDLLPGQKLPEKYGALALPLSYPNAWDRTQHKGGDGIWIHGADSLDKPFSARGTQGCVTMRPEDLREFARNVEPDITPVLIDEQIPYVRADEWHDRTSKFFRKVPVYGLVNLLATRSYIVVARREGETMIREYYRPEEPFAQLAVERDEIADPAVWASKLSQTQPTSIASLLSVQVRGGDVPQAIIETTAPVEAGTFSSSTGSDRVVVDLLGVRPGVLPEVVDGKGSWIRQIRIAAADDDPPTTRLVFDLKQPVKHQVTSDGTRTLVTFTGS